MVKQRVNKLQMMAAASLLALAAASTPANADHGHDLVVPMVTVVALGALAYHGHSRYQKRHSYRYRSYGYRQYRPGQHGQGHSGHKTQRSYSQGGYYQRPRHSGSQGGDHQSPRHSSSQGGYHQPRRKY